MLKWFVILGFLAAVVYYAVQEWPDTIARWKSELARLPNGSAQPAVAGPGGETDSTAFTAPAGSSGSAGPGASAPVRPAVVSWSDRNVGGLKLNLPVAVQSYTPPQLKPIPPNIYVEFFKGQVGSRSVFISHATSSILVGAPMLAWADKSLSSEATRLNFEILSKNTATTMVNGLRARRSDFVSESGAPRIRARCVLLERGSQLWFVECHAPEDDSEAEGIFLKIAYSAQQL